MSTADECADAVTVLTVLVTVDMASPMVTLRVLVLSTLSRTVLSRSRPVESSAGQVQRHR